MNKEQLIPYSFEEASTFGGGFPDRGIKCYKCNTYIPHFQAIDTGKTNQWKNILKTKGADAADDFLISLSGCNYRWAKIWRLHPNGPTAETKFEAEFDLNMKCPYCGKVLRTKKAKQCLHCNKNWRDKNV